MKKWERADNYTGEEYPEYYVAGGRSRDSDAMERANFDETLFRLGGESETVKVVRSGHWAVGWIETILIHESDTESVAEGNRISDALATYPVLDDERYSQYETDEISEYWETAGVEERKRLCKRADIPVSVARRKTVPYQYDELYEILRNIVQN